MNNYLLASSLDGLCNLTLCFLPLWLCQCFFNVSVGWLYVCRVLVLILSTINSQFGKRFVEVMITIVVV